MFGVGIPEMAVIALVAALFVGPDRIPDLAKQAAHLVRAVRRFTNDAQESLRTELGPEFKDLELRDLNPKVAIRKHIIDPALAESPDQPAA